MVKRKTTKLPAFLGLTPAQAAERLTWHMEEGPKDNIPPLVCAAAWALSVLPLSPKERVEFLKAAHLKEKPTPQGMMLVVEDKPVEPVALHHADCAVQSGKTCDCHAVVA